MTTKKIAIVGGGLAGLSAAYTLSKQPNVEVHCFEEKPFIGGRVQSRTVLGHNVDLGGFLMYPWYTEAHKLFAELEIADKLVKIPENDIYYVLDESGVAQKEDDIPFSIAEGLRIWTKSFWKILQTTSLSEPDLERFDGKTTSEYLRWALGTTEHAGLYETFFDTVNQGYCYGPITESKAAFMAPIVRQVKFHGDIRSTSFFANGSQTLTNALAGAITANGGTIHLDSPITQVDGLTLRFGTSEKNEFTADAIVFAQTVESKLYAQILPKVVAGCTYTHFIAVAVELPSIPIVSDAADWGGVFYAPDETQPTQILSAIHLSALYGSDLESCVVLNIILRDQNQKELTATDVSAIVARELPNVFPQNPIGTIIDFIHWKQTMPIAQEQFVQAVRDAQGRNGYSFAGDFLGAPSMETAIATGRNAANAVIADLE